VRDSKVEKTHESVFQHISFGAAKYNYVLPSKRSWQCIYFGKLEKYAKIDFEDKVWVQEWLATFVFVSIYKFRFDSVVRT
jgi:hypothetical protein